MPKETWSKARYLGSSRFLNKAKGNMVMVRALLHFFNDKPKETWSYELIAPTESQNKMSHSVHWVLCLLPSVMGNA